MTCAQDYGGANCKLAVTLDLTRVGLDATTAKGISQAALQLGTQGIVTRVSIVDDPAVRTSFSQNILSEFQVGSERLNALAPLLHKLELHPVPALSASIVGQKAFWRNHVNLKYSDVLQANQSLQAVCVVHDFGVGFRRPLSALPYIVSSITHFGSLRKSFT